MDKDKRLMETSWWERQTVSEPGSCSGLIMVWEMKVIGTFFKRTWAGTLVFNAHHPAASHSGTMPLLETPGHSQASLAQSFVGTLPLLLAPGEHKVFFVPSNSLFQSWGSSIIKSNWPPKSNSLRVLNPFARSAGWEICSGPKTSLPVQEFL